jgi:sugar-specific transcriptional regulator TrmB
MDHALRLKLEKSGLSDNESAIYSYLLDVGGAYPSAIASATAINRSTVYKTLLTMTIKGIVNEIEKGKKQFYQISNTKALSNFARSQIRIAEGKYDAAEQLLPTIEKLIENASYKPRVQAFEGEDAVMRVMEDHISQQEPYEMTAISNADKLFTAVSKHFFDHYRKTKEHKQITTRGIVPDTRSNRGFVGKTYVNFGIAKRYWPELKYIDPKLFSFDAELTIYGKNKVSIVKLTNEKQIGIIIEDDVIYQMAKMMFELIWAGQK